MEILAGSRNSPSHHSGYTLTLAPIDPSTTSCRVAEVVVVVGVTVGNSHGSSSTEITRILMAVVAAVACRGVVVVVVIVVFALDVAKQS